VDSSSWRRFGYAVAALALLLVIGTVGYRALGDEGWIDSLYRSVLTVSLTGIDSTADSTAMAFFTIVLLLLGLAIFAYVAGAIVEAIAQGVVGGAWAERRRRRTIDRMRDHFIICGYGRVGRRSGRELGEAGMPFVVLDFSDEAIAAAAEDGAAFVSGNGTSDADLLEAGIDRARALLAASDSDVDNLTITLSARALRPELTIVARASTAEAERKLRLAGADRVVQPYAAAGMEMAKLSLKPQVAAFLDIVSTHGGPELRFEEIEVTSACGQSGRTIRDLRVRHRTGALIVGLRKRDGAFDTTPDPDTVLEEGDVLIGVGTNDELNALEELFAPGAGAALAG
jgi:voltage-gated potassium channel